jgi:hypothetical protein
VRAARPGLLTVKLLRWGVADEKYEAYRDTWRFELSEEGRKAICEHVESGGGLLGLHTASICFDGWPGWGDVLGAEWVWGTSYHPPLGPIEVVPTSAAHPITEGLERFALSDEVYTALDLRDDVTGLLEALPGDGAPAQPLLWARAVGEGRVVYDALGHDVASMSQPMHARVLTRAALWALGRDEEIGAH